jgi:hypothetical protein
VDVEMQGVQIFRPDHLAGDYLEEGVDHHQHQDGGELAHRHVLQGDVGECARGVHPQVVQQHPPGSPGGEQRAPLADLEHGDGHAGLHQEAQPHGHQHWHSAAQARSGRLSHRMPRRAETEPKRAENDMLGIGRWHEVRRPSALSTASEELKVKNRPVERRRLDAWARRLQCQWHAGATPLPASVVRTFGRLHRLPDAYLMCARLVGTLPS